jgi:hypothetical protein
VIWRNISINSFSATADTIVGNQVVVKDNKIATTYDLDEVKWESSIYIQ